MEESDKLPYKRVELSLSKFNEVAIPHHLDLLRQHKANILKHERLGAYGLARAEQAQAQRATGRLRALLGELEALRARVLPADRARFDDATQRSRDLTLRAIMDYLETSPLSGNRRGPADEAAGSSESVGVLPLQEPGLQELQLQVNEQEPSMEEREELLRGWAALQAELRALHDVWQHVHGAALQQRGQVRAVSEHAEVAQENVQTARSHLSAAERLRGGAAALGGACAGALVGGPAGLLLGLKAGAAAALAGSVLGYLGVRAALPCARPQLKDE